MLVLQNKHLLSTFEVLIPLMIYFTIALRMLNNSNAVNSQGIQSVSQEVLENKQRMHCQRH